MSKDLREKFQDIVSSEIIERDDKFYARLDDYFENEKEYGGHWKYFSQVMPTLTPTAGLQELMKYWEDYGIITSAKDVFSQPTFSLIDYICLAIDATLQRLDVGIKTRLRVAEQLKVPYKHSHCGLLEFFACHASFTSSPIEIIVLPNKQAVIGFFYQLAYCKESEDFPSHISISLNQVVETLLKQKLEVKFDRSVMLTNKEAKILSAVQEGGYEKIEVNYRNNEPHFLLKTNTFDSTKVHEALVRSASFSDINIKKRNNKVAFIEISDNIKL